MDPRSGVVYGPWSAYGNTLLGLQQLHGLGMHRLQGLVVLRLHGLIVHRLPGLVSFGFGIWGVGLLSRVLPWWRRLVLRLFLSILRKFLNALGYRRSRLLVALLGRSSYVPAALFGLLHPGLL